VPFQDRFVLGIGSYSFLLLATWSNVVQSLAKGLRQEEVPSVRISHGQGKDKDYCAQENISHSAVVVDHAGNLDRRAAQMRLFSESHLQELASKSIESKVLIFV